MTMNEERINKLFDELVPLNGKSETLAGEIIRAITRIDYRYYNDGDKIGVSYGNETCNAPARFLKKHCSMEISNIVDNMWGEFFDMDYEEKLDILIGLVADYVDNNPNLRHLETENMWDYSKKEDCYYDEDYEY